MNQMVYSLIMIGESMVNSKILDHIFDYFDSSVCTYVVERYLCDLPVMTCVAASCTIQLRKGNFYFRPPTSTTERPISNMLVLQRYNRPCEYQINNKKRKIYTCDTTFVIIYIFFTYVGKYLFLLP